MRPLDDDRHLCHAPDDQLRLLGNRMFLTSLAANADLIVASMAALSIVGAIVAICWPYFAPDILQDRIRQIGGLRGSRGQAKGQANEARLTTSSNQIFKRIFDRMNLAGQA